MRFGDVLGENGAGEPVDRIVRNCNRLGFVVEYGSTLAA
jgi:hypothetical protein